MLINCFHIEEPSWPFTLQQHHIHILTKAVAFHLPTLKCHPTLGVKGHDSGVRIQHRRMGHLNNYSETCNNSDSFFFCALWSWRSHCQYLKCFQDWCHNLTFLYFMTCHQIFKIELHCIKDVWNPFYNIPRQNFSSTSIIRTFTNLDEGLLPISSN
jgi:hypothetical protein